MPFHHHTEGQGIVGDWSWRDGRWVHDPQARTPITVADYDPNATRYDLPAVGQVEYAGHVDYVNPPLRPTFTTGDESVYERPDPDEFDCFDDVDSTTIVDDGGPQW